MSTKATKENKEEIRSITSLELAQTLADTKDSEQIRYCFLIGAGASVSSGIPLGKDLARRWYGELKEKCKTEESKGLFNDWCSKFKPPLTEKNAGNFYSPIYEKRFGICQDLGYEAIAEIMEGKEPCGST